MRTSQGSVKRSKTAGLTTAWDSVGKASKTSSCRSELGDEDVGDAQDVVGDELEQPRHGGGLFARPAQETLGADHLHGLEQRRTTRDARRDPRRPGEASELERTARGGRLAGSGTVSASTSAGVSATGLEVNGNPPSRACGKAISPPKSRSPAGIA